MQDRFKFKVLDTTNNKIYSSLEDLSKEEENAHFLLTQDGAIIKKYYNSGEIQLIRMLQYRPIFCTGLKSTNGKLVYEGDIVKFSSIYGHGIFEIKWSDELAAFCYEDKETDFSELGRLYQEAAYVEVIGNIYENPELLESKA